MSKLFFGVIVISLACGNKSQIYQPPVDVTDFTKFQNIAPVVMQNCALSGCHGAVSTQPVGKPMNLSSADLIRQNWIGVTAFLEPQFQRVRPGWPDSSYVVQKLSATNKLGSSMPPGGKVPQPFLDGLKVWIKNGALNN